jgi:hypothetical protein
LKRTSPSSIDPGESANLYAKTLRREVLPDPLAPMIAIISEGLAYPLEPVKIYFIFSPCPMVLTFIWYSFLAIGDVRVST